MNHEIIIENFKSDEHTPYSVIILKGRIINKPNLECQTDELIYISSILTNLKFTVVDNKFKALAELQLGANVIELKHCCQCASIKITYNPRSTIFSVLPLYIICDGHDGKFQAPKTENNDIESACKRITTCSKLLQSIIGEKLYEGNLGRKSFKLGGDCQVVRSKINYLKARQMTQEQLWSDLGREILNSDLGRDENRKFLAFLSCTEYRGGDYKEDFAESHEDIVKLTDGYVALGGGGLALFGTACLFTWPEDLSQVIERFEDSSLIDRNKFMDDSCYRGTFGGCFSTTLGSILHELCHTFDLGHTEKGIMGRGFDNIHKVFLSDKERGQNISKIYQIEFKETFSSGLLSEKLQDKKKEYHVNMKTTDEIFWTKSCLMILGYHKWFNDFRSSKNSNIRFDPHIKVLTSTSGLRVVELRSEEDGMVLKEWTFDGRVLKYCFQIPEDALNTLNENKLIIFVEDNVGNVLKENLIELDKTP